MSATLRFMILTVMALPMLQACAPAKREVAAPAVYTPPLPQQAVVQEPARAETPKPVIRKNAAPAKPKATTAGWVENVVLGIGDTTMKAKLDTGAKTSSIRAEVIKVFGKKGKKRVLYSIEDEGEKKIYESPLSRWVRIKKKDGGFLRRPVVLIEVCLAGHRIHGEVNLATRPNMIYPLLIGRNMLKDKFILHPGKTFLTQPVCKAPSQ